MTDTDWVDEFRRRPLGPAEQWLLLDQLDADPDSAPGWVRKVAARVKDRNAHRERVDGEHPGYLAEYDRRLIVVADLRATAGEWWTADAPYVMYHCSRCGRRAAPASIFRTAAGPVLVGRTLEGGWTPDPLDEPDLYDGEPTMATIECQTHGQLSASRQRFRSDYREALRTKRMHVTLEMPEHTGDPR